MGAFTAEIDAADAALRAKGEQATLTKYTTTTPDADKPWLPGTSSSTTQTVSAVFLDFNTQDAGVKYFEGELILADDKKVLVTAKALTFAPHPQGSITRADGSVYRILRVKDLNPNGEHILYTLMVRK